MRLLTSYKDVMRSSFKEYEDSIKTFKFALKDGLAKSISYTSEAQITSALIECPYDTQLDHIVYDLSGYMVHCRKQVIGNCKECWQTLITEEALLPDNCYADSLTVLKDKGGLKKSTVNWFLI